MFTKIRNKKDIIYKQRILSTVCGLNILHEDIVKDTFKFLTTLQKDLNSFQQKSHGIFIDMNKYNKENVCEICLFPLLGPCSSFDCSCKLTIHEGCMFRLVLGGFTECPQCRGKLSLYRYCPRISYPRTYNYKTIQNLLTTLIEDIECNKNITPEKLLLDVKRSEIIDNDLLKEIYK